MPSDSRKASPPGRMRQLRAFCHAAQTGSISKAADRLCVSQPSVSQLIRGLENDLGTLLFERRGPRILLTEAGQVFLEAVLPIIESMDNLPAVFRERLGQVTAGSLNIAAGESTILYLLADFVGQYCKCYPEVHLHLHNVTGRDGLAMLRAGDVDFAVGSLIEQPEDIGYVPIASYDPVLITGVHHPLAGRDRVTLEEVSRCGLILPPRHLSTSHIVDLVFRQHGLRYQVVLEAGGWEVIKRFVELGLGVSIVTSICLTGRERLAAIDLSDYFPRRTYGVVMRSGKQLSPQARRFIELMDPQFNGTADGARPARPIGGRSRIAPRGGSMDFTGEDASLG